MRRLLIGFFVLVVCAINAPGAQASVLYSTVGTLNDQLGSNSFSFSYVSSGFITSDVMAFNLTGCSLPERAAGFAFAQRIIFSPT